MSLTAARMLNYANHAHQMLAGPLLLSIFNSLLKHLRTSVDFERSEKCKDSEAEKMYQEALINAMGDFANALPDYQKVRVDEWTSFFAETEVVGVY